MDILSPLDFPVPQGLSPFIHNRHPFQVQPSLAEGQRVCDPSMAHTPYPRPLSAVASLWTAPIVTFSIVFSSDDTPLAAITPQWGW